MEETERCLLFFYNHFLPIPTCPFGLASKLERARRKRRRRRVHVVVLSVNGTKVKSGRFKVTVLYHQNYVSSSD